MENNGKHIDIVDFKIGELVEIDTGWAGKQKLGIIKEIEIKRPGIVFIGVWLSSVTVASFLVEYIKPFGERHIISQPVDN